VTRTSRSPGAQGNVLYAPVDPSRRHAPSRLFTRRVGRAPVHIRARQGRTVPGGWSDRVPGPADPPVIEHPHTT